MFSRIYLFSIIQLFIFFLSFVTNWYIPLVIILFLLSVIMTLDKLGKGIVLREIIALHTCLICLLMPLAGYEIFNENNNLSRLWVKFMPIPFDVYFGYALPAISGFVFTLCWPISSMNVSDNGKFLKQRMENITLILKERPNSGVYLLVIGTFMFWASGLLPQAFQFTFFLFYFAAFAGVLYVYYTKTYVYRLPVLLLFSGFIIMNAVSSGMFTIVAYMGLTLFSFFFLGRKTPLWKKLIWFSAGIFVLLVIQIAKPAYRNLTWKKNYEGNKGLLLADVMVEKMSELNWNSADAFFSVYVRTNQGFNVALVMKRIPRIKPHDNGKRLMLTLASSLVPRFFWPDKPEAGGKFNMEYYTGYIIHGWSTNIGPLGEAYGSYGVGGGIVYLFFLGAFIRWAYKMVFSLSRKIPLIIFWIPVLFYQVTYSAESDTLQIMNSLIKSAFFIFILFRLFPSIFMPRKRVSPFKIKQTQDSPFIDVLTAK